MRSLPPGLVGGEKEHNPCDVLRLTDPPHGGVGLAGRPAAG